MFPSPDQLYGDADLIFLEPAHTAIIINTWCNEDGNTVLDWPENLSQLILKESMEI